MGSSSPQRSRGGGGGGGGNSSSSSNSGDKNERPRFFDTKAKSKCWSEAKIVPGRHPERWRFDAAGNVVCKRLFNCLGCLCYEYDHIIPYSKGGESVAENCQILQTRVNRFKSDKERVEAKELQGYSCEVKFTEKELDIIEMGVYGDVIRPGNECRCRTVAEMLDKELDVIEMAVYGDVIRPGKQCRCQTVAEMLGEYKSKDRKAACKLPFYDEARVDDIHSDLPSYAHWFNFI